jgi:cell division septal protein FtsQ
MTMKPQVVSQKVGNRSGIGNKARSSNPTQKPARRERDSNETLGSRLRTVLGYAPLALKIALLIATGIVVFLGYRAAASASFFQVRSVETRGTTRASADAIERVVRQDVGQTGVWRADLVELSAHLERLPWVRTAVVTRVLPDGVRVRVVEREPRLVVRTSAGRFIWVDDDGVFLEDMKPTDQMPDFFLRGWNEDGSASAAADNRERVSKFLQLQRDWNSQGLSERVSEVNLLDLRDVRAQLAGDDSQIEIRLGAQDHGQRLRLALNVLDKQRETPRGPFISYIDLSQGKRAIVGLASGNQTIAESESSSDSAAAVSATSDRNKTRKPAVEPAAKEKETKTRARKADQRRT